jgi:hypothetical protein
VAIGGGLFKPRLNGRGIILRAVFCYKEGNSTNFSVLVGRFWWQIFFVFRFDRNL